MKKILIGILSLGFVLTNLCVISFVKAETESGYGPISANVICLGCSLKKEQGAKAKCSIYGHVNAIRTKDGKIWTILENENSTELINNHDYAGKEARIQGKKFADAQIVEVESFKIITEPADAAQEEEKKGSGMMEEKGSHMHEKKGS